MEKSSNIVWGSEAIRLEHEAIIAEIEALRARFDDLEAYCGEMDRLSALLKKYKHRWCWYVRGVRQEPSQRLYGWVDRYESLTGSRHFGTWCDLRGLAHHDVYDALS